MRENVHERQIQIRTYELGNNSILVEGILIDRGFEKSKPLHHMIVRMKVKGPELIIEEAEATMPYHPKEGCPEVLPWIRDLVGLKIVKGYSTKIKETIGGTKGCAHLTSLITAMGPAAVQAYQVAHQMKAPETNLQEEATPDIINTCYLWREDGPLVKKLREAERSSTE